MIASLDGGATADGKAGGLAGPGDRSLFSLMRYAADVILVGAATVRVENYSGAQVPVAQRHARQSRGQAEVPPIAVVTRTGNLDPDARFFTRTEVPPLILTCADSVDDTRRRLGAVAEVLNASGPRSDEVDGGDRAEDPGRARAVSRARRGRAAVVELADRGRPARRALPDGGADPGRRPRAARSPPAPAEVHTTMRPAHLLSDDAGLPVHPLRPGSVTRASVLWSACIGVVSWSGP